MYFISNFFRTSDFKNKKFELNLTDENKWINNVI